MITLYQGSSGRFSADFKKRSQRINGKSKGDKILNGILSGILILNEKEAACVHQHILMGKENVHFYTMD